MSRTQIPLYLTLALCGLAASACSPPSTATPSPPPGTAPTAETLTIPQDDTGTCAITATRTPPPGAPTYGPDPSGSGTTPRTVDPHVEMCASMTTLAVGQTLSVVGQPVDLGLPIYMLRARDAGSGAFTDLVRVSYTGGIEGQDKGASRVLEFVSVEADITHAVFVLHAAAPGVTELEINVSGEIHYGYPGPAMWGGGGSEIVTITVTE